MSNVTLYGTSWCAFCKAAKLYLDGLKVPYEVIDIEKDTEAAEHIMKATGQAGVPVIRINNNYIVGFQKQELSNALRKEGLAG